MKTVIYTAILILIVILILAAGQVFHGVNEERGYLAKNNYPYIDTRTYPVMNGIIDKELLIPRSGEHSIKIWGKNLFGSIKVQIVDQMGNVLLAKGAKKLDEELKINLEAGKYRFIYDFNHSILGGMVFAIDKMVVPVVKLDESRYMWIEPNENVGFRWPYLLYLPSEKMAGSGMHLLVISNNTGAVSDNMEVHEESAKRLIMREKAWADELGVPLLVPIFPRYETDWKIYTHALDRDSMETNKEEIKRLDLQVLSMIEDARGRLGKRNIKTADKVLLYGFSASGMFANRFTLIHPDKVEGAACGSPGGWPMVPTGKYEGRILRYPVGTADVRDITGIEIDWDTLRQVPMFFFLGEQDTNDSVPYEDSFDIQDRELIFELFGEDLQKRWGLAEEIYQNAGCRAEFKRYPEVGHTVNERMRDDILDFFKKVSQ